MKVKNNYDPHKKQCWDFIKKKGKQQWCEFTKEKENWWDLEKIKKAKNALEGGLEVPKN